MPTSAGSFLLPAALLVCCAADAQLVEASRKGDVEAVRELLAEGADVNRREGRDTPLTAAVRHGHIDIVRLLLDRGADPTLPYGDGQRHDPLVGRTPVEIAAYSCRETALALLAERDATVRAANKQARRSRLLFGISRHLCGVESRQWEAASEVRALAGESRRDLWYLFDTWPAGFDRAPLYLRELEAIGAALRDTGQMDAEEAGLVILRDVAQDLELKAADCRLHGAARVAPVAVHTVNQGQPSPGWQLFYISKFMAHFPEVQPEAFPSLSSPARYSLPPGRYVVTARMPGSEEASEPQTITIGGNRAQEEWQIPVP